MEHEALKRSYRHLTSDELREEIEARKRYRYNVRKVGAADCMIDSMVIGVCYAILKERGEAE